MCFLSDFHSPICEEQVGSWCEEVHRCREAKGQRDLIFLFFVFVFLLREAEKVFSGNRIIRDRIEREQLMSFFFSLRK